MVVLRIAFVGAGAVNFGGAEGPWDHASRLEKYLDVEFVGLADPLTEKATEVIKQRQRGKHGAQYTNCRVYGSPEEMLKQCEMDAVFIGIPPVYRGCLAAPVELQFLKAGVHCFIEKPLSVVPLKEFEPYYAELVSTFSKQSVVASVGYMFRYHPAVQRMRELILGHGGAVMAVNARYYLAYSEVDHAFWWNIDKSGGPIVEQATHFCDLARYLAGDVDLTSVQVTSLPATDRAGTLSKITPGMEDGLGDVQRVPRVTSAQWRFQNGGVGSLMHAVAIHGKNYETHFDVLMDGLRMTLYEPYLPTCKLIVRRSGSEVDEVTEYACVDMYAEEVKVFLESVRDRDDEAIKSKYKDAAKTYEFTWKIRELST